MFLFLVTCFPDSPAVRTTSPPLRSLLGSYPLHRFGFSSPPPFSTLVCSDPFRLPSPQAALAASICSRCSLASLPFLPPMRLALVFLFGPSCSTGTLRSLHLSLEFLFDLAPGPSRFSQVP